MCHGYLLKKRIGRQQIGITEPQHVPRRSGVGAERKQFTYGRTAILSSVGTVAKARQRPPVRSSLKPLITRRRGSEGNDPKGLRSFRMLRIIESESKFRADADNMLNEVLTAVVRLACFHPVIKKHRPLRAEKVLPVCGNYE